MRGKVTSRKYTSQAERITPAYAGKSSFQKKRSCRKEDHPRVCGEKLIPPAEVAEGWDHPRVCGEKTHPTTIKVVKQGSPPRMRGKAQKYYRNVDFKRITPAYAGKSPSINAKIVNPEDHPRVCGEKWHI